MSYVSRQNEDAFEALEAMLLHIRHKQNNQATLDNLRNRFVTASSLCAASPHLLEENGLHPHDALLVSKLVEIYRCVRRSSYPARPMLNRLSLASDYLISNAIGLRVERFYMLCLDTRGRMKECTFLHEGTSNGAIFPLKEMLREVVRVSPSAVVLSHNHPGQTLRPSQEDLNCTLCAIHALTAIGVPLLDHIIVAGEQAVSLRENGFFPASVWLDQAKDHKLLNSWLSKDKGGKGKK